MTPTGSITWEAINLSGGDLYLPQGGDNGEVAQLLQSNAVGDLIGSGKSGGNVYESPANSDSGLVVKEFTPRIICDNDISDRGDLASLRANVMLAAGFETLAQRRGPWRIDGAPILGALVMREGAAKNPTVHARWIIRKILPVDGLDAGQFMPARAQQMWLDDKGNAHTRYGRTIKPEQKPYMPSPRKRQKMYEAAMSAANDRPIKSDGLVVNYDDHPGNMILAELPTMDRRRMVKQGRVVKLDVKPVHGFDF